MRWTRLSFFYLIGYLSLGGVGLLFAPEITLRLFGATTTYPPVLARFVGAFMVALAIVIAQIVRHRIEVLYPTTLLLRLVLIGTIVAAVLVSLSTSAAAQAPNLQAVARNLVEAGMVKTGDKVLITGSVRDAALMEDIAIETMKAGGQPMIALGSERLTRRSYDDVPASYDSLAPTLDLAIVNTFDVQIAVDIGEVEGLLAGVPQARRAARAKAGEPVTQAFFRRNVRFVNLGNGLYPTATLARRLAMPQSNVAAAFWKAAGVSAPTLRTKGEALRASFADAKQVTLTHRNGTNLTFGVDAGHGFVSDGAITPEKVEQGRAAVNT